MSPLRLCTLTGVFLCAAVISLSESLIWKPPGPVLRGRIEAAKEPLWRGGGQPWEDPRSALPVNLAARSAGLRPLALEPDRVEAGKERPVGAGAPGHLLLFQPAVADHSAASVPRP